MIVMTVTVADVSKKKHSKNVDSQANPANDNDHLGFVDFLNEKKSLDGLHSNGETECEEEYRVDQGAHHLCSGVAVGVPPPLPRGHSVGQTVTIIITRFFYLYLIT